MAGDLVMAHDADLEQAYKYWRYGCDMKLASACAKTEKTLDDRRAACAKDAKACVAFAALLPSDDNSQAEAQRAYERACKANDAWGCFEQASALSDADTKSQAARERLLDRACTLEAQPACCSLAELYHQQGKSAKARAAYDRGVKIKENKYPRVGCDINLPG